MSFVGQSLQKRLRRPWSPPAGEGKEGGEKVGGRERRGRKGGERREGVGGSEGGKGGV